MALTLRLVCGATTADIARAFLVSEPTMAVRTTRAKKEISAARIPFRLPGVAELPDRPRAVLGVSHLLFTAGHTAPSGPSPVRTGLMDSPGPKPARDPASAEQGQEQGSGGLHVQGKLMVVQALLKQVPVRALVQAYGFGLGAVRHQ